MTTTDAQNTGGASVYTLSLGENLVGSAYDDVLVGDAGNNEITGGLGADALGGTATAVDRFVCRSTAASSPANQRRDVNSDLTGGVLRSPADFLDLAAVDATVANSSRTSTAASRQRSSASFRSRPNPSRRKRTGEQRASGSGERVGERIDTAGVESRRLPCRGWQRSCLACHRMRV